MRGPRGFWNNGMLSWLTASNFPLHLTAARLRFGIKPNGSSWAAQGVGGRYACERTHKGIKEI